MSITEYIKQLDAAIARIESGAEQQVARAGLDLVGLISTRVIQQGKTADGGRFTPYSRDQIPAFFYFNRSRNNSGEQGVRRAAKEKRGVSYAEFRQLNGLKVDFKNFEFTGDMWRNFRVKKVERTGTGYRLTIGGASEDARQKIEWLSDQEGRLIIEPSRQELAFVQGNLTKWAKSQLPK